MGILLPHQIAANEIQSRVGIVASTLIETGGTYLRAFQVEGGAATQGYEFYDGIDDTGDLLATINCAGETGGALLCRVEKGLYVKKTGVPSTFIHVTYGGGSVAPTARDNEEGRLDGNIAVDQLLHTGGGRLLALNRTGSAARTWNFYDGLDNTGRLIWSMPSGGTAFQVDVQHILFNEGLFCEVVDSGGVGWVNANYMADRNSP